jgi:hypothetical protein
MTFVSYDIINVPYDMHVMYTDVYKPKGCDVPVPTCAHIYLHAQGLLRGALYGWHDH